MSESWKSTWPAWEAAQFARASVFANNGSSIVATGGVANVTAQTFGVGANGVFAAVEVGRPGAVVPEPATMVLLATGLLGLAAGGLRRRSPRGA